MCPLGKVERIIIGLASRRKLRLQVCKCPMKSEMDDVGHQFARRAGSHNYHRVYPKLARVWIDTWI